MDDRLLFVSNEKATKASLRERNQRVVLQQILSRASESRAEIARATGLTRASVSALVGELIDLGMISEVGVGAASATGGKPPRLLEVNEEAFQVVSVDVSGNPPSSALMTIGGRILDQESISERRLAGSDLVAALAGLVDRVSARAAGRVVAVAVATPGLVRDDSIVTRAANLDWTEVDLAQRLRGPEDCPTIVLNDARAAALAEYALAPVRPASTVAVLVGRGVGAGIVLNGRLYRGASSSAGEIGHIDVGSTMGCTCGREGCLETVASLPSLVGAAAFERALSSDDESKSLQELLIAVEEHTWARAAEGMGSALAALTAVLDVEEIVIGGPLSAIRSSYLGRVQRDLDSKLLPGGAAKPVVRISELGPKSVLLGASLYAVNRLFGVAWAP